MRKSVVYLFVSVFFLFMSCEYQLGENFVEMEKPSANSVLSDVYLNLSKDYEGRYYVNETQLVGYTVYLLQGYDVEKCVFRLGEMEWENADVIGDFLLDVNRIPNGNHDLVCEVHVRTNSGTVAGQLGTEHYIETRSWPLKVEARDETNLPLPNRVNEDGYLELSWEVDEALRSVFDHYTIELSVSNYTYIRRSTNFDQRSFVDMNYIGAGCTYRVYIYFKDESIRPYSLGKIVLEQIDPQVKVEYPTAGKIRLSWSNPYRSLVDIVYQEKIVAEKVADGTAEFSVSDREIKDQSVELRFFSADGIAHPMTSFSYMFNLENKPEK